MADVEGAARAAEERPTPRSIAEDTWDERRAQEHIQKLTDKYVAEVDKQFAQKETELMAI